ncbi:hypothetical protein FACS189459_0530 [Bacilli bacterium]|nr:hypothetical protein FACS189459_0530 [Bacilli bacterium]
MKFLIYYTVGILIFNMYKEKAIKILTDNTKYAKDDITKISDGSCGYSNTNFFVDLKDGKKFTIRVANYGKVHKDGKVLYDRENEYLVSTSLGKKYIYYNHKTGDFITNYINGICYELSSDSSAKAIAERNKVIYSKNYLTSSGKKLKKLHNCKITDKITQHNKFFGSNTDLYKKIIPLKYQDALEKIANKYQTTDLVPTHYDIGTQNIIYDKKTNNLEFIDFELSTVESKFWDIAYFL